MVKALGEWHYNTGIHLENRRCLFQMMEPNEINYALASYLLR